MQEDFPLMLLAFAWLVYFMVHSILASIWLKELVAKYYSKFMPYYRLLFNVIAILALIPVVVLLRKLSGNFIWQWQGIELWITVALSLLAGIAFIHSLKYYDMQEFAGFRQIKEKSKSVDDQENLHISPYHHFVRHPWYFFAIVIIWMQSMDTAWLVSCIMLTLYFWLGSKLEDIKLIKYYGQQYRLYKTRVAGILPLPWRILSKAQAPMLKS